MDRLSTVLDLIFETQYEGYRVPFESINVTLRAKSSQDQGAYRQKAKELLDNEVYRSEFSNLTRHFYMHLATKATNDMEREAYKITLLFIQQFEKRLTGLVSVPKPTVVKPHKM